MGFGNVIESHDFKNLFVRDFNVYDMSTYGGYQPFIEYNYLPLDFHLTSILKAPEKMPESKGPKKSFIEGVRLNQKYFLFL